MTKKELSLRFIRRFSITKKIYKSLLLKKLSTNAQIKTFNEKYLNFTLKEKEIFHGLSARLFYDDYHLKDINVNWKLNFCDKIIKIPLETDFLKIDWHTAVSVIGTDVEVKAFYKNIICSDFKPKYFFDIGANFATHSMLFLLNDVKAISFEPNSNCHGFANKIAKVNNLNLEIESIGLGRESDNLDLVFPKNDTGLGSITGTHILEKNKDNDLEIINITVKKLDDYISEKNIIPDLIKIDTEGHEYEVFKGAKQTLIDNSMMIVFESVEFEKRKQIFELLGNIDYQIYDLKNLNKPIIDQGSFYAHSGINFLCLRKDHPAIPTIKTFTVY